MIVETIIMTALPAAVMITFVRYKITDKFKKILFSIPVVIPATLISWVVVGHIMTGVMAGPAILLCDLLLCPAFILIKNGYEKRCWASGRHPYEGIPWMQKPGMKFARP